MRIEPTIVNNTKTLLLEIVDRSLADLKDRITSELMNLELSILYHNRAYGQTAENLSDIFLKLSEELDNEFNNHQIAIDKSLEQSLGTLAENQVVY